ncbi:hypothetical protein M2164_006221 [Streptomyces sp. SAI-208]|uniref:hypothetical protein n=1 Tax=unclassified Streptomyces TaxID=2593676 RepID=UPI002476A0C9|nr:MULTISPECIES: hypothetical protein [unclassified Streptomyces]MDH6519610.1 hypothetical protein [Streptomyces sp. SAI-090]MDH6551820.1 hypothetical protein [Streptomyces sp. SAI-041]MDH6570910.1 hypothetical protein [Streptomyces sp. SAI-117]MDH6584122.1 hypothetical protein [Streptomyces sp. SAI-133]MDH6610586.1 hypothetical protein [Streptomyces sp. SAI-208]
MTNLELYASVPADLDGDLASLRGDCARMAPHWAVPDRIVALPVSPSLIHGVTVPEGSARLLEAMSEYGD